MAIRTTMDTKNCKEDSEVLERISRVRSEEETYVKDFEAVGEQIPGWNSCPISNQGATWSNL